MKTILAKNKRLLTVVALVFIFIFLTVEIFSKSLLNRTSVWLALGLAIVNFPVLIWIYDRGISTDLTEGFRAMGYSMLWKFIILFGTTVMFHWWPGINVLLYFILLFFLLFCLSFIAIYMAYSVKTL